MALKTFGTMPYDLTLDTMKFSGGGGDGGNAGFSVTRKTIVNETITFRFG